MHDLTPITALGSTTPQQDTIGTMTISENPGLALASVAARMDKESTCAKGVAALLGADAPGPGHCRFGDPISGFWTGPDQWMLFAPVTDHDDLASDLKAKLGDAASVTEQTGGWVAFDVQGSLIAEMCERLCALPIRRMQAGDAQRTMIHQLGCFIIPQQDADHILILGPRASAGSLHHALMNAASAIA